MVIYGMGGYGTPVPSMCDEYTHSSSSSGRTVPFGDQVKNRLGDILRETIGYDDSLDSLLANLTESDSNNAGGFEEDERAALKKASERLVKEENPRFKYVCAVLMNEFGDYSYFSRDGFLEDSSRFFLDEIRSNGHNLSRESWRYLAKHAKDIVRPEIDFFMQILKEDKDEDDRADSASILGRICYSPRLQRYAELKYAEQHGHPPPSPSSVTSGYTKKDGAAIATLKQASKRKHEHSKHVRRKARDALNSIEDRADSHLWIDTGGNIPAEVSRPDIYGTIGGVIFAAAVMYGIYKLAQAYYRAFIDLN